MFSLLLQIVFNQPEGCAAFHPPHSRQDRITYIAMIAISIASPGLGEHSSASGSFPTDDGVSVSHPASGTNSLSADRRQSQTLWEREKILSGEAKA
ncbi:hypothetical protein [Rubinisphaera margarita]|uniref:hypothetical protein n=1 Tax=Rubinisphaera margarita TaxID=2909586 RepID=UPI001EE87827|nr:hypothetical protein [Rubinisphaera margarita]MCG6156598.1 hypothetical protein [Rubinisphaera margarita]